VLDETHHLLSVGWEPAEITLAQSFTSMVFITVEPKSVARAVLESVDIVIALGKNPAEVLDEFVQSASERLPTPKSLEAKSGEALLWARRAGEAPFRLCPEVSRRRAALGDDHAPRELKQSNKGTPAFRYGYVVKMVALLCLWARSVHGSRHRASLGACRT